MQMAIYKGNKFVEYIRKKLGLLFLLVQVRVKMCIKQWLKYSVGAPFPLFRPGIRGSSTLNNRTSPIIIIAHIPIFYNKD